MSEWKSITMMMIHW
jgi:hypothetical protein